jgi:hypothetical protein
VKARTEGGRYDLPVRTQKPWGGQTSQGIYKPIKQDFINMKYIVLSRLNHNQKIYEPDETVQLNDEEAGPLVFQNVIAPVIEEKKEEPPVTPNDKDKGEGETEDKNKGGNGKNGKGKN